MIQYASLRTRSRSLLIPSISINCVLYARVSKDKQAEHDLSIPVQLQAMRKYATQRGWTILSEYVEPGASAKTAERPELQRLLTWLRGTQHVDVLLVHKIDRLARNVFDHAMIKALLKHRSTKLASMLENIDDSVSGELVRFCFDDVSALSDTEDDNRSQLDALLGEGGTVTGRYRDAEGVLKTVTRQFEEESLSRSVKAEAGSRSNQPAEESEARYFASVSASVITAHYRAGITPVGFAAGSQRPLTLIISLPVATSPIFWAAMSWKPMSSPVMMVPTGCPGRITCPG
jgi:hypothetical protein